MGPGKLDVYKINLEDLEASTRVASKLITVSLKDKCEKEVISGGFGPIAYDPFTGNLILACDSVNVAVKLAINPQVLDLIQNKTTKARITKTLSAQTLSLSDFIKPTGVYNISSVNSDSEIKGIRPLRYLTNTGIFGYLATLIQGDPPGDDSIYFTNFDKQAVATVGGPTVNGSNPIVIIGGGGGFIGGLLDGSDNSSSSGSSDGSSSGSNSSSSSGGSSSSSSGEISSSSSSGSPPPIVCDEEKDCNKNNPFSPYHCLPQSVKEMEKIKEGKKPKAFCVNIYKFFNNTAHLSHPPLIGCDKELSYPVLDKLNNEYISTSFICFRSESKQKKKKQ